ncbi:N-acetyltransferase [Pontibacter sp. Tf4]|uniref:GNAT family N-acetyltransferase n=1 Tax=Pontibacter sp. Tf4 TaxID=2761620 RepID=UPI0016284C32|nr:N-acetyltransferase [Pontibacter sp. Tf4]MBB6612525.1 N-acetyltransferase [Pontibacter sp. Tf4]
MKITIRQEEPKDYTAVSELIEEAFRNEAYSDHKEHFLVKRLRKSDTFIPELSMVAEVEGTIVGHILLTRISIVNGEHRFPSLALAPVSVKPAFQGKGIGSQLIREAHSIAKALGYSSIVLLGHENYYPRFGYELTDKYNIRLPFDAPKENCMILPLSENALTGVTGMVEYPKEFYQ